MIDTQDKEISVLFVPIGQLNGGDFSQGHIFTTFPSSIKRTEVQYKGCGLPAAHFYFRQRGGRAEC